MQQREMVPRSASAVRYAQGRAAVRYKHPVEVVDVRYLPRPIQNHRRRKAPPEWLQTLGMILLFRIMPALLALALLVLIVRPIFTS